MPFEAIAELHEGNGVEESAKGEGTETRQIKDCLALFRATGKVVRSLRYARDQECTNVIKEDGDTTSWGIIWLCFNHPCQLKPIGASTVVGETCNTGYLCTGD